MDQFNDPRPESASPSERAYAPVYDSSQQSSAPSAAVSTTPPPATTLSPRGGDPSGHNAEALPRLIGLLVLLSLVAISPFLAGQFQYHLTRGRMQAEVEVASTTLSDVDLRLEDFELASRMVAKRMSPSVVSVHRGNVRGPEGQGSGVIVDASGYIVTNEHVVRGASDLHVRLLDGRLLDAVLIGADPQIDVAVIKVEATDLIAAEWGDSEKLDVGDLVWAVGSPYGLDFSVTFGIVSAKNRRSTTGFTESLYQEFLQTDVAINPGNSGGPLVDRGGKVVGINTMIVGERYSGISFSVPANMARETYEALRQNGTIERGYLGVMPIEVPEEIRKQLALPVRQGVLVGHVEVPSPAALAGLEQGDIILSWNGSEADDPTLLSRAIAATPIGSKAKMKVVRGDRAGKRELELDVTVGGRPQARRRGP
jgi:S1-C subfamily serine protease